MKNAAASYIAKRYEYHQKTIFLLECPLPTPQKKTNGIFREGDSKKKNSKPCKQINHLRDDFVKTFHNLLNI